MPVQILTPNCDPESKVSASVQDSVIYDVAILGAGPVGLFGCFYAGLRGMKTLLIDSLPELGGQLSTLYPEKYVFDMPGFARILAKDLATEMAVQGTRFGPDLALGERVEQLTHEEDHLVLTTAKTSYATRTVVVCAGAGAFDPKKLDCAGAQRLEGAGVYYFVRDREQFRDQRLLIVGGGDSALDWAMNLEPLAQSVTLIHRRDAFRAHEDSVDWLLNRSQVATMLFWETDELVGRDHLERAIVRNNKTGEALELEVDACLINIGFNANIGPIRTWGLDLEHNHILVNSRMETNLPGVYAAGDICTYSGKLKLIATGVGEAAIAVNYARTFTDPSAKAFPGHTSNMDL